MMHIRKIFKYVTFISLSAIAGLSVAQTTPAPAAPNVVAKPPLVCQYLCLNLNARSTNQQTTPENADFVKKPEYAFSCQFDPPGSDLSNCKSMTEPFIKDALEEFRKRCDIKSKPNSGDIFKRAFIMCSKGN